MMASWTWSSPAFTCCRRTWKAIASARTDIIPSRKKATSRTATRSGSRRADSPPLGFPQNIHGIGLRRPQRRQQGSAGGYRKQQKHNREKGAWIEGRDAEQHAPQKAL